VNRRASTRLALKIALRTSARSVGRSALIVAMVALPVTGLVGIAVVADSHYLPSTQDTISTQLGLNEARLTSITPPGSGLVQNPAHPELFDTAEYSGGQIVSPREALPGGTRILPLSDSSVTATTATGLASISVREGQSWDPAFAGMYDVTEGRAPHTDGEVMVTASLLERLGKQVGNSVELLNSTTPSVKIVGIIDDNTRADSVEEIFARSGALSGVNAFDNPEASRFYLPDTTVDWTMIQDLNSSGITTLSRSVLLDPPPSDGSFPEYNALTNLAAQLPLVLIVAGFAAFEVILLAGAAFTVTARQQQRTLATIASVGAPRRLLFRILTANGIVLGTIGGLVGVVFGIAGAAVLMVMTADGSSTQYYGFHIPWLALGLAVLFAVLIGWVASLLPARATSRFNIVAALRGSRMPPAQNLRRPIVGIVMVLGGTALTLVGGVLLAVFIEDATVMGGAHPFNWVPIVLLIVGPILLQLGLILSGPLLLRIVARLMQNAGLGARLAARDSARNPGRAVPSLAAIMTTVFVAVFGMCLAAGSAETSRLNYQYNSPVGSITVRLVQIDWGTGPASGVPSPPDSAAPTVTFYQDTDAVEEAIRSSVSADHVRVISAVPDPFDGGNGIVSLGSGAGASSTIPLPTIPPQNLCPLDTRSPEFSADATDSLTAQRDERCQNYYLGGIDIGSSHLFVGDAADLALVLGHEPSAEATRTLASGGAVSLYPDYVQNNTFTISWWTPQQVEQISMNQPVGAAVRTESLNAVVDLPAHPIRFGAFISPATAQELELDYRSIMVMASTTSLPTTEQQDALRQAMATLPGQDVSSHGTGLYAYVETGPTNFAGPLVWGLLALAGLIAIASSAVAIGLARFDGRQDDATLGALGAGRVVRKNFAFWQAIIIAGLGSVLGAATGLVPAWALSGADLPFVPPWLEIGIVVVALPLLIACGSWLLATRSSISAGRMTIS